MYSEKLKAYLSYPKFKNEKLKVIVIDSGYFLVREMIDAFLREGHEVYPVSLYPVKPSSPSEKPAHLHARPDFLENLLMTAAKVQADVIYTVNMLGFDTEGTLLEMLDYYGLYVLNWFVDTPFGIIENHKLADRKNIFSLCWEKSYIPKFRELFKYHKIEYMPYATAIYQPLKNIKKYDITFIGSSMESSVLDWQRKAEISMVMSAKINNYFNTITEIDTNSADKFIEDNNIKDEKLIAAIYFIGSKFHRQNSLKYIANTYNVTVFGDENWRSVSSNITSLKGTDYYSETPQVYKESKISLNFTSPQMKTAVNQRVFDCFAAGGFLLSDYREDIKTIQGLSDIPTFSSKEELLDKCSYYLKNQSEREKLEIKLSSVINQNHTYRHRVIEIVKILRNHFQ